MSNAETVCRLYRYRCVNYQLVTYTASSHYNALHCDGYWKMGAGVPHLSLRFQAVPETHGKLIVSQKRRSDKLSPTMWVCRTSSSLTF